MVNWRIGLVLLAVMVALGAYIYQSRTRPAPAPPAGALVPCDSLNTVNLTLRGRDLMMELERASASAEWRVTRPQPGVADPSRVAGLFTNLHGWRPAATVEHPQPSGYGLETPHLVVTCRVKGGPSYNLSVGDQSLDGSGYYVRRSDDPRVYVVSAALVDALGRSLTEPPLPRSPVPAVSPSPTR